MARGAWWTTVHGVAELDTTEPLSVYGYTYTHVFIYTYTNIYQRHVIIDIRIIVLIYTHMHTPHNV